VTVPGYTVKGGLNRFYSFPARIPGKVSPKVRKVPTKYLRQVPPTTCSVIQVNQIRGRAYKPHSRVTVFLRKVTSGVLTEIPVCGNDFLGTACVTKVLREH